MTTLPIRYISLLCAAFLHASCSTLPNEATAEIETKPISNQKLIDSVVDAAPKFAPFGFKALTLKDVEENLAQWAKKKLDLGDRLKVVSIDENSPANDANLKTGDVIISINNEYISKGKTGTAYLRTHIVPRIDRSSPVELVVIRDGFTMQFIFPQQLGAKA